MNACGEISSNFNLSSFWHELVQPVTFSELSSILSLGLSLYIALVIIQVASSVGISTLRRRVDKYQKSIKMSRRGRFIPKSRELDLIVQSAEIDIDEINSKIIKIVSFILLILVPYYVTNSLVSNFYFSILEALILIFIYVALPILIYVVSLSLVSQKLKTPRVEVDNAFSELARNG